MAQNIMGNQTVAINESAASDAVVGPFLGFKK
jgi:hypothetical protein